MDAIPKMDETRRDGLRDKLLIDMMGAISAGVTQLVKSTDAIAQAVVVQATATAEIVKVLQLAERAKALETMVAIHQAGMDRHREEHRRITVYLLTALIAVIVFLVKEKFFP